MKNISVRTPAKINLTLDIIRKREDGYHDLSMVMQTVDLCDKIHIDEAGGEITVECSDPRIPCDGSNLAYKAADMVRGHFKIQQGVRIRIDKRIPLEAGLAGGSANAAGVLKALDELWDLKMDRDLMLGMGRAIGADVPYCILGGTKLAEGIGDVLTDLGNLPEYYVLLVKPDFSISTGWAYSNIIVDEIKNHPNNEAMCLAIRTGDLDGIEKNLGNVFEAPAFEAFPELSKIKSEILNRGAKASLMSGSGPTVYGLYRDKGDAERALRHFRSIYKEVHLAKTCQK
ncbi:4-(cytidine 5'-diphospho)-2-C-methyl-D-erythritol kinase [Alkalibacter mobilis]|uniref:4-(cytidine 5'-diphospho)-2-C-methyl-D-erythritol kinase n=1 Tax=Alkalibacter mobilis TaxID=2787712 RepID=UPI00189DEA53|nr:4-(cytidine 5'-diphospho)-2-C-methyl-D-erythritol kinase [Alkalibacter mobilis]MBF7096018.1 4-(cytidine 5'-diphospho)-2-C-methyl-D-erythritol kinase [Alkalibacter mobilis]